MKRYEALLALDIRGKEDTAKETIERLEKVLAAEGAVIEQVQRLEKRELAYESKHTKSAYYVNFIFEAEPATIDKLQKKLKLEAAVLLQNYLQLPPKKTPVTP
ncbi:MAG: 30S ribosomal protein S6 [Verrucomicrobiae bacterium]